MRKDGSGRYYILSAPGSSVLIFDANGNQVGQIPNSHSNGATLRYGVDLDLTPTGDLVVADRGGNAIDVFGTDGSFVERISVFAPTSVVALPNGQFGVTSLRTDHPVQIIDDQGRLVRGFGDPAKVDMPGPSNPQISFAAGVSNPAPAPAPLADLGRVTGDSQGHLYFAKISTNSSSAPEIRKYDRFGYMAYAAELPTPSTDQTSSVLDDRVQFSFSFTRLSRSDQETEYTTIGDSGKIQFGSGLGMGLSSMLAGHGGGGMRGGGFPMGGGLGASDLGLDEAAAPTIGRGGLSGSVTGEGSLKDASMHLHLGLKASQRRTRTSAATSATTNGQSPNQGTSAQSGFQDPNNANAVLQYGTSNYFSDDTDSDNDVSTDAAALQFQSGSSDTDATGQSANSFAPVSQPDLVPGPMMGGSPGFLFGGLGPRPGFGARRGFLGGERFSGARPPGASAMGAPGGTGKPPEFGPHGHFGASTFDFVGSVRINLDRRHATPAVERSITAVGIDHQNEEVWAAIGSMLVHFDKDGAQLDTYYLTTPEGAALRATAILVEPDRLVIASDSRGIYDFPRPDRGGSFRGSNTAAAASAAR